MDRRSFIGLIAAAPLVAPGALRAAAVADADYARAIVIDGQSGLADPYGAPTDPRLSAKLIAELRQSGLTALSTTLNDVGNGLDAWPNTIRAIAELDQVIVDNADHLTKALSAADIRRAKADGRLALIYNTQDTSLVGPDLDRIATLKGLGIRIVQLTYNLRNLSGDGCLEPGNAGISKLGRATIARIEKEKLLLDLSHSGQRTVAEGIAAATRPMTISHTGCRDLHDNPRNQRDTELKACADKGGVVGIYWMPFLVPNGKPTADDLVRHVAHAVDVCGEDHVAIGTDGILSKTVIDDEARARQKKFFTDRTAQGIAAPGEGPDVFNIVAEWDTHLRYRKLADGLAAMGWKAARIDKLLGGNLMRLYAEIWGG